VSLPAGGMEAGGQVGGWGDGLGWRSGACLPVEPEAQIVTVEGDRRRVAQIEVGHSGPERREVRPVAGAGAGRIGACGCRVPRVPAEDLPAGRAGAGGPDEVAAVRAARGRGGTAEERVRGAGVVEDVVDDDTDAAAMGLAQQAVHVGHGSVVGLDAAIVADRVAVVAILGLWR
jgi:hypothetical protein